MRPRVLVAASFLVTLGSVSPCVPDANAQECRSVAFAVVADAAPLSARLDQGTAIPIPIAYSHVEHETSPAYVYTEAGSTSLGPLEGVVMQPRQILGLVGGMVPLPIDLPDIADIPFAPAVPVPAGRAASTYPKSSLSPVATGDWGVGKSRTEASATRAYATSGIEAVGLESRIESSIECETLTVEAGWTLAGLHLPGGIDLGHISQTIRIEFGPVGEPKVDVDTVILDESLRLGGLFSDLPDELLGEIFAVGGQEFAIGDPEVTVTEDGVWITARPVAMKFAPPGGTQAVSPSIGLIELDVERLGIGPSAPDVEAPVETTIERSPRTTDSSSSPGFGSDRVGLVAPATPGEVAAEPAAAQVLSLDYIRHFGGDPWWPPLAAMLLIAAVSWRVAKARRDSWPTADWTLAQLESGARWFHATYLRW